jgi:signal transduction histidine kinase
MSTEVELRPPRADAARPAALADFISGNLERILEEWEKFAGTLLPSAATLDRLALRDHAAQILAAIAAEMRTPQTSAESTDKSRGESDCAPGIDTAAGVHGTLRHEAGFDLVQVFAEFRALRASVLRLWAASPGHADGDVAEQMTRFNEGIDQALAESVARFCEDVDRARDTFVAVLGHNLRTPLQAISAGAASLAGEPLAEDARLETIEGIRTSAAGLGSMIRDLLELTRTRLGRAIPINRASVDVQSVVWAALDEVSVAHPRCSFRAEIGQDLVAAVDSTRLQQAITNLLANAVEHGRAGGTVDIAAVRERDCVVIEVGNAGSAIPASMLQVLFDPVLLHAAAATKVRAGAPLGVHFGLGLFIAREVALGHGGSIDVRSDDERTVFTLRIPVEHEAAKGAAPLSIAA